MRILYSNILPLPVEDDQQTILDCFFEQAQKADRIEKAVGYISQPANARRIWMQYCCIY